MGLFQGLNNQKNLNKDKDQLLNNVKFADSLSRYSGLDMKLANTIGNIADKLKYFNASSEQSVFNLDKKIENKLADLKIELAATYPNEQRINACIKEVTNLIADREYESKKR